MKAVTKKPHGSLYLLDKVHTPLAFVTPWTTAASLKSAPRLTTLSEPVFRPPEQVTIAFCKTDVTPGTNL